MRFLLPGPRSSAAVTAAVLAFLLVGAAPRPAPAADGRWFSLAPSGKENASVYDPLRDRLLLFGGTDEGSTSNELWECTFGGSPTWNRLEIDAPRPPARHGHSMVYDSRRDRLIVFGGMDSEESPLGDLWTLQLGLEPLVWVQVFPGGGTPADRFYHAAAYDSLQDRMVVVGGAQLASLDGPPTNLLDDVWMLSLGDSPQWIGPETAGQGLRCAQAAVYDPRRTRVVLFGGYDGAEMKSDTWALSLSASPPWAWSALPTSGPLPDGRAGMASAYDSEQDRLLVFGGVSGSLNPINEVWQLALATSTWEQLAPTGTPPSPRMFATGVYDLPRHRMLTFGTTETTTALTPTDHFWALSLGGTPAWTQLSIWTGPVPRGRPLAVFDAPRNRMVVAGGRDDSTIFDDAWQLSLGTSMQWTQLYPGGTVPQLDGAAAICDTLRQRMVAYCGSSGSSQVSTLSLSGSPVWAPFSPLGIGPQGRYAPSAVYDGAGDRLILFGGQLTMNELANDTWVLDLAGPMAWSQLRPHGTPPPGRWAHMAVYDPVGERMLIFGGFSTGNDSLPLGDVWQLSMPDTTWTQLTPAGTPPVPRAAGTAVYDPGQQRMIVFGGNLAPPVWATNETWGLDLSGPTTWTPFDLGTETTPPIRSWHSAAFDPYRGRMINFGGWLNAETWILEVPTPIPPAVAVSLLDASAVTGEVRVRWQLGTVDGEVAAYRSDAAGAWVALDRLHPDAQRVVTLVDRNVTPGTRYGYCLGIRSESGEVRTGEIWLDVPASTLFALHGCRPNPTRGLPVVSFSLLGTGRAQIEVLDVAGRCVLRRDVSALGAGEHVLGLSDGPALPAGVYLVRLVQGTHVRTSKVTVLR